MFSTAGRISIATQGRRCRPSLIGGGDDLSDYGCYRAFTPTTNHSSANAVQRESWAPNNRQRRGPLGETLWACRPRRFKTDVQGITVFSPRRTASE